MTAAVRHSVLPLLLETPVPENRHLTPRSPRARARSSGVEAAAVRRLAARQPTPKSRDPHAPEASAAEEAAVPDDAPDDSIPPDGAGDARQHHLPWALLVFVALTVLTLVCGGLAAWFGAAASALTGQASARNHALSDPGETSQVKSQVTNAIDSLFSYNYANPGATEQAARRLLTGAAVKQYATLFAGVKRNAVKNKLVVTTTVSNAGVEMLTGNTARVLVFATESDGSAGATTPATAEAMLAVNVVHVGSAWKIAGIDTFAR